MYSVSGNSLVINASQLSFSHGITGKGHYGIAERLTSDSAEFSKISTILGKEIEKFRNPVQKIPEISLDPAKFEEKISKYIELGQETKRPDGLEELDDFHWGVLVALSDATGISRDMLSEVTTDDLQDYEHEFVFKAQDWVQNLVPEDMDITGFDSADDFWNSKFIRQEDGSYTRNADFEMLKLSAAYSENDMKISGLSPENSRTKGGYEKELLLAKADPISLMYIAEGFSSNDGDKLSQGFSTIGSLSTKTDLPWNPYHEEGSSNSLMKYYSMEAAESDLFFKANYPAESHKEGFYSKTIYFGQSKSLMEGLGISVYLTGNTGMPSWFNPGSDFRDPSEMIYTNGIFE